MTGWQIYWLTRLDGIGDMFGLVFALSLVALLIGGVAVFAMTVHEMTDEVKIVKLYVRRVFFVFLASNLGWFVPTSKEMAAILIVPKIINAVGSNKKLTNLPDKVLDLANAWIEELGPEKKK